MEVQWQSDRPLKVLHWAPRKALRRGSWDYHGKRQGGRERTACHLPADKRQLQRQPDETEKAHKARVAFCKLEPS